MPLSKTRLAEAAILDEFHRSAGAYEIRWNTLVDEMSILQHHGAPTRLLDFTRSFYVAAYFAVEKATTDAAVWAVNPQALANGAIAKLNPEAFHLGMVGSDQTRELFDRAFYAKEPPTAVLPLEPVELSGRFSIQQGAFVAATNISVPFEHAIAATFGIDPSAFETPVVRTYDLQGNSAAVIDEAGVFPITKLILQKGCHRSALEDLWAMNISAASLFPGVDGFARSLSRHLRRREKDAEYEGLLKTRMDAVVAGLRSSIVPRG